MILSCPECDHDQRVNVDKETYQVVCESCGEKFKIPRERRKNKQTVQEHKSRVNVRIGWSPHGDEIAVGWSVQSAEKSNSYLEKESVLVDVSNHPKKTHWYVAIFKTLQHIEEYKSARIWIKHDRVIDHLKGDVSFSEDDPREVLKGTIIELASEKFLGCEFGKTNTTGGDIRRMVS